MALKEILDKIMAKLPADAGDEINALLADAKREAATVLADLSSANAESKSRREKLEALKSEIEAVKAELEAEKVKANDPELDKLRKKASDYDTLQSERNAKIVKEWQEKFTALDAISKSPTDKRKDKVKDLLADFQIPAEGQEITPEIADANLKLYRVAEKAGGLAEPSEPGTGFQRKSGTDIEKPTFKTSGAAIAASLYPQKT